MIKNRHCLAQCCYSVCILLLNATALYSSAMRRAKWNLTWFAFMLGAHTHTEHSTQPEWGREQRSTSFVLMRSIFNRIAHPRDPSSHIHPPAQKEALTQTHNLSSGKWVRCALILIPQPSILFECITYLYIYSHAQQLQWQTVKLWEFHQPSIERELLACLNGNCLRASFDTYFLPIVNLKLLWLSKSAVLKEKVFMYGNIWMHFIVLQRIKNDSYCM